MRFFLLLILSLGFISLNASAEIYRSVDKNGVVSYSDQPDATSKKVELPAANITSAPVQPAKLNGSANIASDINALEGKVKEEKKPYSTFALTSPKDQDSIFNSPEISASTQIVPDLQAGDKIQFFLDGAPVNDPSTETSVTIPKVRDGKEVLVRGAHTLSAKILSKDGEVINSTPDVTFFLHYTANGAKKPLPK